VYAETNHFTTAGPIEVCKKNMRYEVAKSFLGFSCEVSQR